MHILAISPAVALRAARVIDISFAMFDAWVETLFKTRQTIAIESTMPKYYGGRVYPSTQESGHERGFFVIIKICSSNSSCSSSYRDILWRLGRAVGGGKRG